MQAYKKGEAMHYIIQILAVILIGTSIGSILGSRTTLQVAGAVVAIALALATLFMVSWTPLTIGAVVLFLAHATQRDKRAAA